MLQSLIAAAAENSYPARIVAVGVDRDCDAARHAHTADIPHFRIALRDYADRDAWDAALTDAVASHTPDFVVTAGFMKILGTRFLDAFAGRIVNTHPALLPSFPGAHAVHDALAYGVKLTGSKASIRARSWRRKLCRCSTTTTASRCTSESKLWNADCWSM